MPFATKSVTTVSGFATLGGNTFYAQITSKDPIRALTINNTAAVNVVFTLGEKVTETSDLFTIPPSTALDFDVWELSDEDIHILAFGSASAVTFSVLYKSGPPVGIGVRTTQQGPKVALSA